MQLFSSDDIAVLDFDDEFQKKVALDVVQIFPFSVRVDSYE